MPKSKKGSKGERKQQKRARRRDAKPPAAGASESVPAGDTRGTDTKEVAGKKKRRTKSESYTRRKVAEAAATISPRYAELSIRRRIHERATREAAHNYDIAKKLNLRDGQRVWFDGMPDSVQQEIGEYALDLIVAEGPEDNVDAAHVFVTERARLAELLKTLRQAITTDGQIWVSWPKKASKVETDITEDTIRELCLPLGLVDTKVCAVDEVWSGLKLVIRKELR